MGFSIEAMERHVPTLFFSTGAFGKGKLKMCLSRVSYRKCCPNLKEDDLASALEARG